MSDHVPALRNMVLIILPMSAISKKTNTWLVFLINKLYFNMKLLRLTSHIFTPKIGLSELMKETYGNLISLKSQTCAH